MVRQRNAMLNGLKLVQASFVRVYIPLVLNRNKASGTAYYQISIILVD